MSASFHAHPYLHASRRKLTVEALGFFAMLQTSFLELAGCRIYRRYLLELGVKIYSYNDHCSAPFSRVNMGRGGPPMGMKAHFYDRLIPNRLMCDFRRSPVGWVKHHQLYSGVGADIVMESLSLAIPRFGIESDKGCYRQ